MTRQINNKRQSSSSKQRTSKTMLKSVSTKPTYASITGSKRVISHNTSFSHHVWALIRRIPPGYVTTYRSIALALGNVRLSQAVGNALRHNMYAPIVPCHRVVASNLRLGGFDGMTMGSNIEKKIHMLQSENVKVIINTQNPSLNRIDSSCVIPDQALIDIAKTLTSADYTVDSLQSPVDLKQCIVLPKQSKQSIITF